MIPKEVAEYEVRLKDAFTKGLAGLESHMNRFEKKVSGFSDVFLGSFSGNLAAEAVSGIASFATDAIGHIGKVTAELEQTKIAFSTMLGDQGKADSFIQELQKFSAATPFKQGEVFASAKQLLAFGSDVNNITEEMRMLGDIAAGLSVPIGDLVYLHGTLRAQGQAYKVDIKQLAMRGIPIYQELANVLGVGVEKVDQLISDGKVGFPEVNKALQRLTATGGRFHNMMDAQSKSINGMWSTISDNIEIAAQNLGMQFLPFWKEWTSELVSFSEQLPSLDIMGLIKEFTDPIKELFSMFDVIDVKFELLGTNMKEWFNNFAQGIRTVLLPVRYLINSMKILGNYVGEFGGAMGDVLNRQDPVKAFKRASDRAAKYSESLWAKEELGFTKWINPNQAKISGFSDEAKKKEAAAALATTGVGKPGKKTDDTIGLERIQAGTRNIKVEIGTLINSITFEQSYETSEAKLKQMVARALVAAVNDVNIA